MISVIHSIRQLKKPELTVISVLVYVKYLKPGEGIHLPTYQTAYVYLYRTRTTVLYSTNSLARLPGYYCTTSYGGEFSTTYVSTYVRTGGVVQKGVL